MASYNEFLKDEKDCAKMCGMALEEYRKSLKNIKVSKIKNDNKKIIYDNSFLKCFGVNESILKKNNLTY